MKNNIKIIILIALNFIVGLSLLLTLVPTTVPYFTNINGKIIVLGSKYFLLFGLILPIVFGLMFVFSKKEIIKTIMAELIILFIYENMLGFSYFCTETSFELNSQSIIPTSLSLFLPISLFVFYYGVKLKNIKYKNKLGIYSKATTTTQFIWTQSHISASYAYMFSGLIMFVCSLVFALFNLVLIESIIFVLLFIIPRITTIYSAKGMTKKYNEMNERKEQQQSLKDLETQLNNMKKDTKI